MVSHWLQFETDQPFIPNLKKFGFVYLIINTQNGKGYVGCKQYFTGKKKLPSKWESYTGSSKYLNEDIKKIGKEHFRFEAIAEYINKRSLRYYEAHYQMKWDVLTSVIEGTDEPAFYNSYVGGKWYRPVESYQDPEYRRKNSESKSGDKHHNALGKCKITFIDGRIIIVNNLAEFAKINKYQKSALHYLVKGYRDFNIGDIYKGKKLKEPKRVLFHKHKDIIKVEILGKEETNGD